MNTAWVLDLRRDSDPPAATKETLRRAEIIVADTIRAAV